jgi:hypothetical protein
VKNPAPIFPGYQIDPARFKGFLAERPSPAPPSGLAAPPAAARAMPLA